MGKGYLTRDDQRTKEEVRLHHPPPHSNKSGTTVRSVAKDFQLLEMIFGEYKSRIHCIAASEVGTAAVVECGGDSGSCCCCDIR